MTKKHFEAMATAMLNVRPDGSHQAIQWAQWAMDVRAIADVFQEDNLRFDRVRFYHACGYSYL